MIAAILRWLRPYRPSPDISRVAHHRCERFKAQVIRNGRRFDQLDREYERRLRCEKRGKGLGL